MLIPIHSDAPVYHFPYATLGLLATASLCSLGVMLAGDAPQSPLLLSHGHGILPWEWVTSLFVLPGFFALVVQGMFLWSFGLVVEGKIGWTRLLKFGLGTAVLVTGFEQLLTLRLAEMNPSSSFSHLIYTLSGMALMWAPVNELTCYVGLFAFRGVFLEIRIWVFTMIYFGLDAFLAVQFGTYSGPAFLNIVSVLAGASVAYLLLRSEQVDCEGADLVSVLSAAALPPRYYTSPHDPEFVGRSKRNAGSKIRDKQVELPEAATEKDVAKVRTKPSVKLIQEFETTVREGNPQGALQRVEQIRLILPEWEIPGEDLRKLIDQTQQMKLWVQCVPLMEEYVNRFDSDADTVRLRLGRILVNDQLRPRHALRILSKIPPGRLGAEMEQSRLQIEQAALEQIEEGVLEIEAEGWGNSTV